jgi:hypothetical protein
MKNPLSFALAPAALALAFVAGPALAIEVKTIDMDSTPVQHEGPCPVTFTITGKVTVDGPGTVSVKWLRSDGATSPATPVTFAAAGTQSVSTTWTLGAYTPAFQKVWLWQKLQVTGTTRMLEGYRGFFIDCQPHQTKFDLAPAVHTPMDGWVSVRNNGPDPSPIVVMTLQCNKNGMPIDKGCPPFPAALGSNPGYDGSGIPVGGWGVISPQLIWIHIPALPAGQSFTLAFPWWSQLKFDPGLYRFPVEIGTIYPTDDSNKANNKVVGELNVAAQVPHLPPAAIQKVK